MKTLQSLLPFALVLALAGLVVAANRTTGSECGVAQVNRAPIHEPPLPEAAPIAPFVQKGIDWLAQAQHTDGGWGAGSSQRQDVRDPHGVQTDPATTAFTGLALVRAGHTPTEGKYRANVERALEYLVKAVETSDDGPRVTSHQGTQPQAKMGPLVDTSLTVQFLSRVVPMLPKNHALQARADAALDRALGKLQKSQTGTGEWGGGGWANSLQGSMGAVALEMAQTAGKPVSAPALAMARGAQQDRFDPASGRFEAESSASIELYAWAGSGRNGASQAREAISLIEEAKVAGTLPKDAEVNVDNLRKAGAPVTDAPALVKAVEVSDGHVKRLDDAALLQGFGNNGGEEFLSYMMTSEALVIRGGEEWGKWHDKMHGLMAKIQSTDGSWTGHHCITSPVFCTAAVVQTLTADRDVAVLRAKSDASKAEKTAAAK